MTDSVAGKRVVITGASAGIGEALAVELHARGAQLVLAARRAPVLAEVAAKVGNAPWLACDVTKRSEVERLCAFALEQGPVDVWINNVGRGISRMVSELDDADIDEMVTVNVKSALYGMQAVLPHFKARGQGHLINVSSMLGRIPFAAQRSAYSGAKHMLNALTANLRMELRKEFPGIVVSTFSPGVVRTEFGVSARHGGFDSRLVANSQSAEEVAGLLADLVARPVADVYSRVEMRGRVAAYYAAEDMGAAEGGMA